MKLLVKMCVKRVSISAKESPYTFILSMFLLIRLIVAVIASFIVILPYKFTTSRENNGPVR